MRLLFLSFLILLLGYNLQAQLLEGPVIDANLWEGKWQTTFGVIEFRSVGTTVDGTYRSGKARIHGDVSNGNPNLLIGKWLRPAQIQRMNIQEGHFEFELSPDGNSFQGLYWNNSNARLYNEPADGAWDGTRAGSLDDEEEITVSLELTYPLGKSPKVFTIGWQFGVKCTATDKDGRTIDLSDQVNWSGSGMYSPSRGAISSPTFSGEGSNTISLSIDYNNETYKQDFSVFTVSPRNYARINDISVGTCAWGCPACPHAGTRGPIITGSAVIIDDLPIACVGDNGISAACCGPNMFKIKTGDPEVLIHGKPAARFGDKTYHCSGIGELKKASYIAGDQLVLELVYPGNFNPPYNMNGSSFEAKCAYFDGFGHMTDHSSEVRWDGSGHFSPARGTSSSVVFDQAGRNIITLTVTHLGKLHTKNFYVDTGP